MSIISLINLEMTMKRCYAVFQSTMMVVVHFGKPGVRGSNLRWITRALLSCQTWTHSAVTYCHLSHMCVDCFGHGLRSVLYLSVSGQNICW